MLSENINVNMSLRALMTSRFLGNRFFPLAGWFIAKLLSLGMQVEKCLSKGVCDNASVVSTTKFSSDN